MSALRDLDEMSATLETLYQLRQRGPDTVMAVASEIEADRAAEAAGKSPLRTQFPDLAGQKKKLRELLDMTAEEHKQHQSQLAASALDFIGQAVAEDSATAPAIDAISSATDNWLNQGCPTAADVRVTHALKLKRNAGFAGFRLPLLR